jgi:hypothetical protein
VSDSNSMLNPSATTVQQVPVMAPIDRLTKDLVRVLGSYDGGDWDAYEIVPSEDGKRRILVLSIGCTFVVTVERPHGMTGDPIGFGSV